MNDEADTLAFDMPFAKVVATPRGECLLIGGKVYEVIGPEGMAAGVFSKALRRMTSDGSRSIKAGNTAAVNTAGVAGSVAQ